MHAHLFRICCVLITQKQRKRNSRNIHIHLNPGRFANSPRLQVTAYPYLCNCYQCINVIIDGVIISNIIVIMIVIVIIIIIIVNSY